MSIFRFNLGDTIHYLKSNKHCSAPVLRRRYIDGEKPSSSFTESCCQYETCHGIVDANVAFASKAELCESL